MTAPDLVTLPARVGRLSRVAWHGYPLPQGFPDPLDWDSPRLGGRFDSPAGDYSVWYFATDAEAAFAEILAPFAPNPNDREFRDLEGELSDLIASRTLVSARLTANANIATNEFVDVEHSDTIRHLELALAPYFDRLGINQLTAEHLKGSDRRITRLISGILHDRPDTLGIRFCSKLGANHECWAVFADRVSISDIDIENIEPDNAAFLTVAGRYDLP